MYTNFPFSFFNREELLVITPLKISNTIYPTFRGRVDTRVKYDSFKPTYDTFTGLKDKNTLLMDLGRKMYKKEDISIGMFDMDNFKSINELLGYKTGDEFIKAISEDVNKVAIKHGVDAYRFGGDEFVVLLFSGISKEEKIKVIDDVIQTVFKNPIIQDKEDLYLNTAQIKLAEYEQSNDKIKNLSSLITERDMLYDIYAHATIAKEDPYIKQKLLDIDNSLQSLYNNLIKECLEKEENPALRKTLKTGSYPQINEYLIDKYDRSHEIFRLKKWIKDFNSNGFNLSGGVATFKHSYYKNKQPIDLINDVGEHLKNSKLDKQTYYVEVK